MAENKYILKWREHVLKAADALVEDDRDRYEQEVELMNEEYEKYKRDCDLSYSSETSFGAAKEIFENALPNLFVKNKKAMREIMNVIKEDKNLYAQFMFLESLNRYSTKFNVDNYVTDAISLVKDRIDENTVKESNRKLYDVIRKYKLKPNEYLNESDLSFYRDCDYIITEKRSLSNLDRLNEVQNRVVDFVKSKAESTSVKPVKEPKSIKEFAEKYNTILTENEKEILSTLLDTTNDSARKKMFESYKKNCLNKITEMLKSVDADEKDRLSTLYETVYNKKYNKETIFEEMLKMIEISGIFEE